jgi:hypothetical protein
MIKLLNQKIYIVMDEYYVLHFYQVRPTIKYYLIKKEYIICIHNFISYIHMIYYKLFIIYFYVKKYWILILFCYKRFLNMLLNKGRK